MSKADDPFKQLDKWIENLTKNENLELNSDIMKHIKDFCKQSPENLPPVYHCLMVQLRKDNAKVRYIALLAINDLFHRSSAFRALMERNMQELMELTLETNPDNLLPSPVSVAERLRVNAKFILKEWCEKHGDSMKRLKIAYSFLQSCNNPSDAQVEEEARKNARKEYAIAIKAAKMRSEMEQAEPDIMNVVQQIENCFQLLMPLPDDLFPEEMFSGSSETLQDNKLDVGEDHLRHHGILHVQSNLSITVPRVSVITIKQNKDNLPILENMNDLYLQISGKYLPMVLKWLKLFSKANHCHDLVKEAIGLKQLMEGVVEKYKEISFDSKADLPMVSDSDSDDNDFEQVEEKEGFEAEVVGETDSTKPSTSSVTPVVHSCSAPLQSGKLCPRQDHFKCPFHGVIIDRDSCGNPIGENLDLPSSSQKVPDWQDPDLLADLEAQTGINLHMPVKRNKKDPKVTAKKPKTSTYQRLCKKLFKKSKQ